MRATEVPRAYSYIHAIISTRAACLLAFRGIATDPTTRAGIRSRARPAARAAPVPVPCPLPDPVGVADGASSKSCNCPAA